MTESENTRISPCFRGNKFSKSVFRPLFANAAVTLFETVFKALQIFQFSVRQQKNLVSRHIDPQYGMAHIPPCGNSALPA